MLSADAGTLARQGRKLSLAVALVLAVVAAFVIYRPDRELPFHYLDFSEFLPILQSSESLWEGITGLIGFYAPLGRANVLPYALLSAKWELFGWWSPGWQWSRFAVMVGILVLAFQLLRRLGASFFGAVAGSSVFLAAPAATLGWVQLTMGEPLGTLMLLALCLTILPAGRLRGNQSRWIVAGLLTAGILLTKEMLAATLVLPLGLLLVTDEDGRIVAPALSRRAMQLLALFSAVGLVCLGAALLVIRGARLDGYYLTYGETFRPIRQTVGIWLTTFAPVDPAHGLPGPAMKVALSLFVVLVTVGWWLHLRSVTASRQQFWLLVVALLFPLVGAIIYAPWPAYLPFYAIPYLIGTSILVAFALTGFERWYARPIRVAAYGCWGALLLIAAVNAHWYAGSTAASQLVHYRLVTQISGMAGIDTVLVGTPNIAQHEWQGPASTLRRYAAAMNRPWPPTHDIPCPNSGSSGAAMRGKVVVYKDGLCSSPVSAEPIVERFRRLSLRRLRLVADSVRIDVESPRELQRLGPPVTR